MGEEEEHDNTVNTRLERCALWSTQKFQRCSLRHNTDDDVNKATKGITYAKMVSKATAVSKVTATTM
jgi:hypothetical protein